MSHNYAVVVFISLIIMNFYCCRGRNINHPLQEQENAQGIGTPQGKVYKDNGRHFEAAEIHNRSKRESPNDQEFFRNLCNKRKMCWVANCSLVRRTDLCLYCHYHYCGINPF